MNLSDIKAALLDLPEKIKAAERRQEQCRLIVDDAKETIELAEINAALFAQSDGKNEKERELQRKAAIAQNEDVKAAKAQFNQVKLAISEASADEASFRRQYGAMLAIAELSAAQLNLQAAQTKERQIEHGN